MEEGAPLDPSSGGTPTARPTTTPAPPCIVSECRGAPTCGAVCHIYLPFPTTTRTREPSPAEAGLRLSVLSVVNPAQRGGSRVLRPGGASELPVNCRGSRTKTPAVGPDGLPIMIGTSARQEPGFRGHPPGSWRKPRVPSHCYDDAAQFREAVFSGASPVRVR